MAFENDFAQITVEINKSFSNICSSLTQILNHARRCAEGFKSKHLQWLHLRCKINDKFSYLQEILLFNNYNKFSDSFQCSVQLSESLLQDKEMVQELFIIFNEYLSYIVKIKDIFDNAYSTNITETIISLTKTELPDFYQTQQLDEKPTDSDHLFQLIPILKYVDFHFSGKISVLHKMHDHLTFLSFHWDIIKTLCELERQREGRFEDKTFQHIFSDNISSETYVCYQDLVYNLSMSSTAYAYIRKVLSFSKEEVEGQVDDICTQLMTIQKLMNQTTQKVGQLTELLVSET